MNSDNNLIGIVDSTRFATDNTRRAMNRPLNSYPLICRVFTRCAAAGRSLAAALVLTIAVAGAAATAAENRLRFTGVNLAGAEFASSRIPGKINKDYHYPKERDIDYFLERGMNTFRLPFRWERLQLNLAWDLEPKELAQLDETVAYITGNGAQVLLDPHNYARYFGKVIGSQQVPVSAFASFWAQLATHFKDNERVIFGLMNEPYRIHADDWREAAQAAIVAIRATGARNLILVPGTLWSGAHSWSKELNGISNASALRDLNDPAGNMAFEVHQYLDSDYSGTSSECQSETIGRKTLAKFTHWLRETGHRGFLGEFGAANNPVCLAALDQMLQHISENSDVWIGWTYWAAGAWWGDYRFSVHPSPEGDKPQMTILMKYFAAP